LDGVESGKPFLDIAPAWPAFRSKEGNANCKGGASRSYALLLALAEPCRHLLSPFALGPECREKASVFFNKTLFREFLAKKGLDRLEA
jgi:hypothetical protein